MTPKFIPGAVYESKTHGLVEFKGIDRYMGQASLRFYSVDHDQTCYWLPSALDNHFGAAQETRPVPDDRWIKHEQDMSARCPHGKPVDDTEHQCRRCGPVVSG